MTTKIYTLELVNGKYYVGKSNAAENRIVQHFAQNGSEWTKLYPPIKVLSIENGDAFDEEKYTLIAMEKYGIGNVRGGSYCKVNLSKEEQDKAQQTIRSVADKCYKCGNSGHFASYCHAQRSSPPQDAPKNAPKNVTPKNATACVTCYKCGKSGHYASTCYVARQPFVQKFPTKSKKRAPYSAYTNRITYVGVNSRNSFRTSSFDDTDSDSSDDSY